jgi:hypothetical protein
MYSFNLVVAFFLTKYSSIQYFMLTEELEEHSQSQIFHITKFKVCIRHIIKIYTIKIKGTVGLKLQLT